MAGAFGDANEMTEEVAALLEEHRDAIAENFGQPIEVLEGHSFTSQVVAGRMVMAKAHVGGGQYVHVKIFIPLPHTGQPSQLKAVAGPFGEADAINPLESTINVGAAPAAAAPADEASG